MTNAHDVIRCRRFIVGLTLLAAVAIQSAARADYPEFAPDATQPSSWPGRNAGYVETDDPPTPTSAVPGAAPSDPAPSHNAPPEPAAEVPAAFLEVTDDQPQRIPPAKPGLPLAPPTAEAKGGWRAGMSPMLSAAASLGIVLGLFLLVVMVIRRGMPKTAAQLPRQAV